MSMSGSGGRKNMRSSAAMRKTLVLTTQANVCRLQKRQMTRVCPRPLELSFVPQHDTDKGICKLYMMEKIFSPWRKAFSKHDQTSPTDPGCLLCSGRIRPIIHPKHVLIALHIAEWVSKNLNNDVNAKIVEACQGLPNTPQTRSPYRAIPFLRIKEHPPNLTAARCMRTTVCLLRRARTLVAGRAFE